MNERRWLALIFGLYILFAFAYSWLMPPWEGPDEPAHYILAVNLARIGKFSSIERNYEAGQPQTYYRLASVPLIGLYEIEREWVAVIYPERNYGNVRKSAPIYFWSDENYQFLPGMYTLRWLNILIGVGALALNYSAMHRFAFEKKPGSFSIPLTALALAALTPQFLHTTSSVANDTLGILAGAFLFWMMSKISTEQTSLGWLVGAVVLSFVFPYTTKLTVLPVGIGLIIVCIFQARHQWPEIWKKLALSGLVLGGGTLLIGIVLVPIMGDIFWRQIVWRAFSFSEDALSMIYIQDMVSQVIWSYWGWVGWLAVKLPEWCVVLLTGLGLVGVGAAWRNEEDKKRGLGEWGVWLVAGLAILAVLKNGLNTINSQGRFLFPAIGALCWLMAMGWERLLPERFKPYMVPGVIILMIAVNFVLWFWGIIPVYYQPFLD